MPSLISTLKDGKAGFFALLWERMAVQGDFPSLSQSVHHLTETIHEENKGMAEVVGAILRDFTLTQKVIRLANSAMYASLGGEITTVTRAGIVLGLDAITNLALSVRFIDTLSASAPDSPVARAEMAKALMAGDIARNLASQANLLMGEEAVVCTLMHHLGRLLLIFYFPEEWAGIQGVCVEKSLSENQATLEIIGVSLDEISLEVAKNWRLPGKIAQSMVCSGTAGGTSIPGSSDWLKIMANFAAEAAEIMSNQDAAGIQQLAVRYGDALLIPTVSIVESVNEAVAKANDFIILEPVEEVSGKPEDSGDRLAAGVQETIKTLAEGMSFGNALNLVLETMYGSMGFNRVVAFLRDGDSYKGKVGFGTWLPEILPDLVFPQTQTMDVFQLSLTNMSDVFIEDALGMKSASSLPGWFTQSLQDVRAFVLLPLAFNGRPIGMLYGDWRQGTSGLVDKDELLLMSSLRDHLMKLLAPKR